MPLIIKVLPLTTLRLDTGQIQGKFVKMLFMATATALDSEFMQYWSKLSQLQKESLLSVAKNFVGNTENADTSELRKQLVEEERASYLRSEGRSYDLEEVKQMARNKEKRNGL